MKKFLPIILFLGFFLASSFILSSVYAQQPAIIEKVLDPNSADAQAILGTGGTWQADPDVTFAGKLAARSQETLNWLLQNYEWFRLQGTDNPLQKLWLFVSYFSYGIIGLFILAAAFLMIITRGRSITIRRFIPRFVFVLALIVFSFAIVSNLFTLTDYLQGFFINVTDPTTNQSRRINTGDLLNVAFPYKEFKGLRRVDAEGTYNESAIISLLLVKLTAATYYTMFIILIIRKIILWFFILVSPIFPLLLFFKPLRNTAKIWIGEMFRWMLYAPLFAIFLRGLVEIWRTYIPLRFTSLDPISDIANITYPTSINILLGGPQVDVVANNSVNSIDTFVLYVVALLMLWMVIIVPWILLRIFLDYFYNYQVSESNLAKYLTSPSSPLSPLFRRPPPAYSPSGPSAGPSGTPPTGGGYTGLAKTLPQTRFRHSPVAEIQSQIQEAVERQQEQVVERQREAAATNIQAQSQVAQSAIQNLSSQTQSNIQATSNLAQQQYGQLVSAGQVQVSNLVAQQANSEILGLTNLSIPTMQDIAKYEAAMMSSSSTSPGRQEVSRISEILSRVAGTSSLTSPQEQQKFTAIRERIVQEANKGNVVAKQVMAATAPAVARGGVIPQVNRVQQVNLDDYEEIKKTWIENYRNIDPPVGPDGKPMARKEWLKQEVGKIPEVIDLLLSGDPQNVEKGMQMVSNILPFLLLGGFSKQEIIAYLKAKLEAAKQVMNEVLQVEKTEEEEESKVPVETKVKQDKTMAAQAEVEEEDDKKDVII